MYTVYIHTNKINKKCYIGITGMTPKKRWKNGFGYANNKYFFRAIEKYGWNNFDHIIFQENLSKEEADKIEIMLIAFYKSNDKKYGYNISAGGEKTTLGIKLPKETCKKMSEAHKGKKHQNYGKHLSEETKRKIGKASSERHHSAEAKEKMRIAKLGKKQTAEHIKNASATRCKVVSCVETDKKHNSFKEAANELNICRSSISEAVNGKRKTAGGYHWVLYDKENARTEVYIEKKKDDKCEKK